MGFEGYKIKHKLIILQHVQEEAEQFTDYAKTLELVLYVSAPKFDFLRFDEMEAIIHKSLHTYSEKSLEQVPPFDKLEPTLENMGDVFYLLLRKHLLRKHISLEMLEISESPVRTLLVSEANAKKKILVGNKKIKLTSLIMNNILSQAATRIVSELELPKQSLIAVEAAPEPEIESTVPFVDTVLHIRKKEEPVVSIPQKRAPLYQFALGLICLIVCGAIVTLLLKSSGAYPSGADIYGHLFKSDLLYHNLKDGNFYPLYTELWYNGMQPFRYWAPLPYYILAMLQLIAGGEAIPSYLLFVFFSFVVGGIGWLLWGLTYNRMPFCTFLGMIWFFLPDNLRVFFVEGNFPRMTVAIFLPYLFYFVWRFVDHRKKTAIVPVIVVMACILLCHVMVAAMTGITAFIFLSLYSITQRRIKESFLTICAMLLSFALCGFWLYPALQGGLIDMDASSTAEVMEALSTPVLVSLNPLLRTEGIFLYFYFGLSVLLLSIFGIFLAGSKSRPGFYTSVIIFFGTTTAIVPFLEKLPLNQLLWMMRFTPIVYAVFLLSLLEWKQCRRYAVILFAIIILIDCVPSMNLLNYHSQTPSKISYTLSDAKEITNQRLSLLDVSSLGSYPSYMLASQDPQTAYTFGWAWQGASTAHNIVMINTALEQGYYYYLFDRSLEMGDDTVLVYKELVSKAGKTLDDLKEGAAASGYTLYEETNYTYLFRRIAPETFGVTAEYAGLAIGDSANLITLEYPSFEEGKSENVSDYSFEELSRYKLIYLSGFTYNDKASVQDLLSRVADAGVRIIVDMNRIPVDPLTSRMSFFDVTAQSITFSMQYPELMYKNKVYEAVPFEEEYSTWSTVYLENVTDVIGYSWFKNKKLPFVGTAENENIIFVGYNFLFHAMETNDTSVLSLMSELMELSTNQLPTRALVPLKIEYEKDKITIDSPGGEVNTTLAYQDNFRSEQKMEDQNNLLIIEDTHTEINLVYPYLIPGVITSLIGLFGIIALLYFIYRKRGLEIEE